MSSDFAHDGSDQYAHLELRSVLDAVKEGRIDPTHVYRTPADEPGVQTTRFAFRLHKTLGDAVDAVVRDGGRYKDRSEAMRQAVILFLACEREIEGMDLPTEPAIIWARLQRELSTQKSIDEVILSSRTRVGAIDGDKERDGLWDELMSLMDYCKSRGWNRRIEDVRMLLMQIRPAGIE